MGRVNGPEKALYLNHGLSKPLERRVARAMATFLEESAGDPTLLPIDSRGAETALAHARDRVAALVGARPEEVLFTSGATEANNLAIKGMDLKPGDEILVGATEHTSIQYPARTLEKRGIRVRWIPVQQDGRIDPGAIESAIGDASRLVAVAAAEPETGTLQPVEEIARCCRSRGVLLLVNAAAAAGQVPIDVSSAGIDLMSLSAHKMGGPRGVGALVVREGVRILPLIEGGVQEGGRRGDTENLMGIAGFGETADLAQRHLTDQPGRLRILRDRMWDSIRERVSECVRHGNEEACLPGHLSMSFPGAEGEALLMGLWRRGIVASSGSACFAHAGKPSYVLRAMGVSKLLAQCSILFTLGEELREADIDRIAETTEDVVGRLRRVSATAGGRG